MYHEFLSVFHPLVSHYFNRDQDKSLLSPMNNLLFWLTEQKRPGERFLHNR